MGELRQVAGDIINSGRYIGGPVIETFEKSLAADTGTAFAVGTANGLDALRLIIRGYIELGRLKEGDEIIVPANTYIASVLAVTDCGLTPVPVEPRLDTLNLDTELVEKAITPATRAIMTVHLYGRACYDNVLADVAKRNNLLVIEDNAQAIGARSRIDGRRTGSLGHAAAFSFYPTKNVGALGDAGAVTTDDAELAAAVRALANYGSDRRYHNIYRGLNSRLDPLQAAFLNIKLPHLDEENSRRAAIAEVYEREINNPAILKPLYST
ncbi:MAG: DegT/DnrJ/EryC1/StrS family aminotransferase, partial [Muribaculaceae bacterium]|nr:DegT/DnrJ/EryC1/StrS family aminotransferase [Muribaculaceae bacterium]